MTPEAVHAAICGKVHGKTRGDKTCEDPKGHTERLRAHAPNLFKEETA